MVDVHRVNMIPGDTYRAETYGIILVSETEHYFTGRGVHNPHHSHSLEVWEHRRPADDGSGRLLDPFNTPTSESHTFAWSPHATVISASPRPLPLRGDTLQIGDVVEVFVSGYPIGTFQVWAPSLHNPRLREVDIVAPCSVQHYIETGAFLSPAEAVEGTS